MCLIIAKPCGEKLPTDETLWAAWDANPGGAGIMYRCAHERAVHIEKGFMRFIDLMDAIDRIKDLYYADLVIHFRRMKNHTPEYTHPYPLDKPENIHALMCDTRMGVAQNGIIRNEPRAFDMSRNMAFTTRVLAPMWETDHCFLDYRSTRDLLGFTTNCKMVFLDDSGFLIFVGEFFKVDGVYYSNDRFDHDGLTDWDKPAKIDPKKGVWKK